VLRGIFGLQGRNWQDGGEKCMIEELDHLQLSLNIARMIKPRGQDG
jgi:hypothetical protein